MNLTCNKVSNTKPEANAAVSLPLHSRFMCPSLLLKPILIHFNLVKSDINANYIEKFSPYLKQNKVHHYCKNKSVNSVYINDCLILRII